MTDYLNEPEWHQPAHRHSELVDPVLTVRQLGHWGFPVRRLSRVENALVFATAEGEYVPFLPPLRPTRASTRRYSAVYEVDMGVHSLLEEFPLPSANPAFRFTAEVDLSWQVDDPAQFIRSRQRDVPRLLLRELRAAATPVTRRREMERSADAEQDVLEELTDPHNRVERTTERAGLCIRWTMWLRQDQGARDFADRKRAYVQEEELRAFLKRKIEFYSQYLRRNGVEKWAVLLADRNDDLRAVVNSMKDEELQRMKLKLAFAMQTLKDGQVEGFEKDGLIRDALRYVQETFADSTPDAGRTGTPGPEDSGTRTPAARDFGTRTSAAEPSGTERISDWIRPDGYGTKASPDGYGTKASPDGADEPAS